MPAALLEEARERIVAEAERSGDAAKERRWLAALPATTGRDLGQWMAFIEGNLGRARRNGIIDVLRVEGFEFAHASWLERIYSNGGRPLFALPAPPAAPAVGSRGSAAVATPPVRRLAELRTSSRPRDIVHARSQEEHARALIERVAQRRAHLPENMFWERLRDLHGAMCAELGWPVRPWNPISTALRRLIGEERPLWLWVADEEDGSTHRLRFYSVPMIAAAAVAGKKPATPTATPAPAAMPRTLSGRSSASTVALCGRVAA